MSQRDDRERAGQDGVSRRDVLAGGAALVVGAAAASCLPGVDGKYDDTVCAYTEPSIKMGYPAHAGRVVEYENGAMVRPSDGSLVESVIGTTLAEILKKLAGAATVAAAWDVILPDYQPDEVIGIKVNVLNAKVPTHPELVGQLVALLKARGIGGEKILVWDRRLDELTKAGYSAAKLGCRLEGTLDAVGTKGNSAGYEFDAICVAGQKAHISAIPTRSIDHLINVAVMKNHFVTGYTGVLKNHYGTIDNPGDFHTAIHKRAVPAINALDEVASKSRLWLLDATVGVCYGDTDAPPDCAPTILAASLDPVALDAYGRQLRDETAKPTTPETKSDAWLDNAEKLGLGKRTVKVESLVKPV